MVYKYLYIDDEDDDKTLGTVSGLEEESKLFIQHQRPTGNWDREIEEFQIKLAKYDGLILDLKLDVENSQNGNKSKYKGTSLAQELRSLSKERKAKEIPVILLSAESNIELSFDKTGTDLFDLLISKEKVSDVFLPTRNKLIGLAQGYNLMRGNLSYDNIPQTLTGILGINLEKLDCLDIRFKSKLLDLIETKCPIHIIANFIINQFLEKNGILISEKLLAARLGIDLDSSDDWKDLLKIVEHTIYTGVFSLGWKRWWMNEVEGWWQSIDMENDLRTMTANQRVETIKNKTGLTKLAPALILDKARSNIFWTLCKGTEKPLDPIDGLLIANQDNLFPWQDREYVSYKAALEREGVQNWKEVSPLEKNKLEQIKRIFSRERIRG